MPWHAQEFEDDDWPAALPPRDRARIARRERRQDKKKGAAGRRHLLASLADEADRAIDFNPTYTRNLDPKHHERRWLLEALGGFYHEKVIDDVLHIVKGGKEANVYCCQASPHVPVPLIAAKIYRPRMLRHLKNDALYKEGRFTRDDSGKTVKGSREGRAMAKKTRFGQDLAFTSWIVHEYQIHRQLFAAGVDVPRPLAQRDNTILMAYYGEPHNPARTLSDTTVDPGEAAALWDRILANIERMLASHVIHGDLSAYNILYWEGDIALIDFPQVVDARINRNAFALFERDILRVAAYFQKAGVEIDGRRLAAELFQRYLDGRLG